MGNRPLVSTAGWASRTLLAIAVAPAGYAAGQQPATRPATATAPATRPIATPRDDLPGLPNFAKVSDDLYRGAQPSVEGFRRLREMGVKTIVSLRSFTSDRADLEGTGLRYIRIPAVAWMPEHEDTLRFLKVVNDPANRPVFVHCQHGADRTGCAVAVYRVTRQGWSMDDAMRELPNFGFHPIWWQIERYLGRFDPTKVDAALRETPMPPIETVP